MIYNIDCNNSYFQIKSSLSETLSYSPTMNDVPSAWHGHKHFAYWLMQETKPDVFVELGAEHGVSYFSFCQSVKNYNLNTKCYAIDTWNGDNHTGNYKEDVFNNVNKYNQRHYAKFSTLIRNDFDSAINLFENNSIGLLHIDGLHTYDAVKNDFEKWSIKLKDNAIVLFHDTEVKYGDFGVYLYFDELKAIYKNNMQFNHSSGLGVICISDKCPVWLKNESTEKQLVFNYFNNWSKQ